MYYMDNIKWTLHAVTNCPVVILGVLQKSLSNFYLTPGLVSCPLGVLKLFWFTEYLCLTFLRCFTPSP